VSLPYVPRLICLLLASFFLVNVTVGLAVNWLAPRAIRWAIGARPAIAARVLLAMRLLPAVAALAVVVLFCVPSYLWFEPEATEDVGLICLIAAVAGAACWAGSALRGMSAMRRAKQYSRRFECAGHEICVGDENVWVMDEAGGLLALAGIVRPRMVASREVLRELSPEQLEAALLHERAHRISRDNLKRLLLLVAPGVLPLSKRPAGLSALERAWARFTEWAADDRAVEGDQTRSVALASALVRVARMNGSNPGSHALVTSLIADGEDLEARVDRLLRAEPSSVHPESGGPAIAAWMLAGCVAVVAILPGALEIAHGVLERLVR